MLILCQGYFSRALQKKIVNFHYIFWKVRNSYFQGLFSVLVSENNYVSNTVETYTNLPVTCLISTKN